MDRNKKNKLVLLKLSGEALQGRGASGHDLEALKRIVDEIKTVIKAGIKFCIVVGGGNLFRGRDLINKDGAIKRSTVDYMGMLATVINALALQDCLHSSGIKTKVFSAISMNSICETFCRNQARDALLSYDVLILAGGTGNPFVSTDTLAAIRAVELDCAMLLKGTQVDGVYSKDPKKDKLAKKYNEISYDDVISQRLGVMDLSAIIIAKEHSLPIVVFDRNKHELLAHLSIGTAQGYEGFSLILNK